MRIWGLVSRELLAPPRRRARRATAAATAGVATAVRRLVPAGDRRLSLRRTLTDLTSRTGGRRIDAPAASPRAGRPAHPASRRRPDGDRRRPGGPGWPQ